MGMTPSICLVVFLFRFPICREATNITGVSNKKTANGSFFEGILFWGGGFPISMGRFAFGFPRENQPNVNIQNVVSCIGPPSDHWVCQNAKLPAGGRSRIRYRKGSAGSKAIKTLLFCRHVNRKRASFGLPSGVSLERSNSYPPFDSSNIALVVCKQTSWPMTQGELNIRSSPWFVWEGRARLKQFFYGNQVDSIVSHVLWSKRDCGSCANC